MKNSKYKWNKNRISRSPFNAEGRTLDEALELAKQKEKEHEKGKDIGFSYVSSLKSMGRIKRTHGKYELGDKYS